MRIALISDQSICRGHGTGVQILRLLEGHEEDVVSFYFSKEHGESEISPSYNLYNPILLYYYPMRKYVKFIFVKVMMFFYEKILFPLGYKKIISRDNQYFD